MHGYGMDWWNMSSMGIPGIILIVLVVVLIMWRNR